MTRLDSVIAAQPNNLPALTYRGHASERLAIEGEPTSSGIGVWVLVVAAVVGVAIIVIAVTMLVRGRRLRARLRDLEQYDLYAVAAPVSGSPNLQYDLYAAAPTSPPLVNVAPVSPPPISPPISPPPISPPLVNVAPVSSPPISPPPISPPPISPPPISPPPVSPPPAVSLPVTASQPEPVMEGEVPEERITDWPAATVWRSPHSKDPGSVTDVTSDPGPTTPAQK